MNPMPDERLHERRAVLVVASGARRGQRFFETARTLLETQGVRLVDAFLVDRAEEAVERVRTAVGDGVPLLIVGGGDGTLRAVLPEVARREVVLGILPLGTANNFARSIGVPMDLVAAVDAVVEGREIAVDLGLLNGEYFANNLLIGYSRDVISATPRGVKRWLGSIGYVLYEFGYLFRQRLFCCTITTDEGRERFLTRHLMVVNGAHYGTLPIAPEASIDDGVLDLLALASVSRWQGLRFWARFVLGLHLRDPTMRRTRASRATVATDPPRPVIVDGEKGPMTPVEIGVAPGALRVMTAKLL